MALNIGPNPATSQQIQVVHATSFGGVTGTDYNTNFQVKQWLDQGYRLVNSDVKIVSTELPSSPGFTPAPSITTYMTFILIKD